MTPSVMPVLEGALTDSEQEVWWSGKRLIRAVHHAVHQWLYGAVIWSQHPYRHETLCGTDGMVGGTVWHHMILYLYGWPLAILGRFNVTHVRAGVYIILSQIV
jgi:hypothetical protein